MKTVVGRPSAEGGRDTVRYADNKTRDTKMTTRAVARYIRVSPRKTRKIIDLIRGLPVVKAGAMLDVIDKRPTRYIKRLLRSAVDSADKKFSLAPADLYVSLIKADQGPTLKRYRAASMGRATMVRHKTTHITLELEKIRRPEKKVAKEGTVDKKSLLRDEVDARRDKQTARKKAEVKSKDRKKKVK